MMKIPYYRKGFYYICECGEKVQLKNVSEGNNSILKDHAPNCISQYVTNFNVKPTTLFFNNMKFKIQHILMGRQRATCSNCAYVTQVDKNVLLNPVHDCCMAVQRNIQLARSELLYNMKSVPLAHNGKGVYYVCYCGGKVYCKTNGRLDNMLILKYHTNACIDQYHKVTNHKTNSSSTLMFKNAEFQFRRRLEGKHIEACLNPSVTQANKNIFNPVYECDATTYDDISADLNSRKIDLPGHSQTQASNPITYQHRVNVPSRSKKNNAKSITSDENEILRISQGYTTEILSNNSLPGKPLLKSTKDRPNNSSYVELDTQIARSKYLYKMKMISHNKKGSYFVCECGGKAHFVKTKGVDKILMCKDHTSSCIDQYQEVTNFETNSRTVIYKNMKFMVKIKYAPGRHKATCFYCPYVTQVYKKILFNPFHECDRSTRDISPEHLIELPDKSHTHPAKPILYQAIEKLPQRSQMDKQIARSKYLYKMKMVSHNKKGSYFVCECGGKAHVDKAKGVNKILICKDHTSSCLDQYHEVTNFETNSKTVWFNNMKFKVKSKNVPGRRKATCFYCPYVTQVYKKILFNPFHECKPSSNSAHSYISPELSLPFNKLPDQSHTQAAIPITISNIIELPEKTQTQGALPIYSDRVKFPQKFPTNPISCRLYVDKFPKQWRSFTVPTDNSMIVEPLLRSNLIKEQLHYNVVNGSLIVYVYNYKYLIYDNHTYILGRDHSSIKKYWRCQNKSCRSTCVQTYTFFKASLHNHPVSIGYIIRRLLNTAIVNYAHKNPLLSRRKVCYTMFYEFSSIWPEVSNEKTLVKQRFNYLFKSKSFKNFKNLSKSLPEKVCENSIEVQFQYKHDGNLFSIYSSPSLIKLIEKSRNVYMGTAFKVCRIYQQIYIIHTLYNDMMLPVFYIFLPKKSLNILKLVLNKIKDILRVHNVDSSNLNFQIVFDMVSYIAFKSIFPDNTIKACLFHYISSILSFIKKNKMLRKSYLKRGKLYKYFRIIMGLPLLNPDDIKHIISYMVSTQREFPVVKNFNKYVYKTYLSPNAPIFPVNLWNRWHFQLPPITNYLDGVHPALQLKIHPHPDFSELVLPLIKLDRDERLELISYCVHVNETNAKYVKIASDIDKLTSEYDTKEHTPVEFLKKISIFIKDDITNSKPARL